MKWLMRGTISIVVISIIGYFVLQSEYLARLLLERQVVAAMTSLTADDLPDGLHVGICGAGGPLPDPERSLPCVFVIAGTELLVFDAGDGAAANLAGMRVRAGDIDGVFLTHFHSDHIGGIGELALQRWVRGNHTSALPLYGPSGVENIAAGLNLAYALDARFRTEHHGEEVAPSTGTGLVAEPFEQPAQNELVVVYTSGDLSVSAFQVDHDPVDPAVGYRLDYKGRSIVISGDTSKSASLINAARGVDVLFHEALSVELIGAIGEVARSAGNSGLAKIMADIPSYHASPVEVAEVAAEAGVDHLVFYHILPALPLPGLVSIFMAGVAEAYEGPVTLSVDGTFVSLPAGSDGIFVSKR